MRIALLGDIALIGKYDSTISNNVEQRVDLIRTLAKECDYVIANLESPLTTKDKTSACKGIYIRSNPSNVETLKYMGITHVTLANNHMYDYGKRGAIDTIKALESVGIKHVGLNGGPEILRKEDDTAVLDGFCCLSANALNYGIKRGQVKMLSYENMREFLVFAEKTRCIPIASVHFGVEGLHYPSIEHINLFRLLAREYKYILHGNHPHAIQGYENYNESLLIYAQGNLCFDKTPVSSFKIWKESKDVNLEEHKSYISIIDIKNNRIIGHKTIGVTDLDNGILKKDCNVDDQLKKYTSDMKESIDHIQQLRKDEQKDQQIDVKKRDISFYKDRMNYKYIGAYINGRIHAKQYRNIIEKYREE